MSTWLLIAALAAGTVALKATGPLLAGGKRPPEAATRVIALLTPALITSLVVSGTFTEGQHLMVGARAAGVAAGALALWAKAPVPIALVAAAVTTALVRAID